MRAENNVPYTGSDGILLIYYCRIRAPKGAFRFFKSAPPVNRCCCGSRVRYKTDITTARHVLYSYNVYVFRFLFHEYYPTAERNNRFIFVFFYKPEICAVYNYYHNESFVRYTHAMIPLAIVLYYYWEKNHLY